MDQLIIEAASIECSEERREISGKIVPMGTGEVGNTNMGGVVFEAGSIDVSDISKIKLLSQHDMKKPVGRMTAAEVRPDGIYATFKLSRSTGGNDALIQAQEGLVSGLSVGAEVIASKPSRDGHIVVSSARLKEVSLVTEPAFKTAQVLQISAEESTSAEENPIQPESEPQVEDITTPVEAPAVEAAAVEAARPTVAAALTVKERTAPITSAQYLEASIKAAMGDDSARRTVLAADDSTSTNTGLTLPQHLNEFVTTTFTGRPAFEAVTRQALPASGMSFTIPKLGTAPTVADTDEGAAPSETGMTSTYDTVTVNKFAGLNRVSWELIDRSSPAFMELLMTELRKAYEKSTDAALIAAFTASGTAATGVAATAAGLQSFISVESAAAYKNTGGNFANKLVASTDQWAAISGYADTTGRALYSAQGQTMNASGAVVPTSVVGNVLGTSLIVDHNIATSGIVDESAFLVAPESVYVWESPTTQLRLQVLQSGELEIALYGYLAIGVLKGGAGVRRFNLA
jgi:HK97 family phage prohead protease/HK97 family phage major capsid protein